MNATVHKAIWLLQTLDVRHLPVVDEEGALVGMLSDRDVRGLAFPEMLGAPWKRVEDDVRHGPTATAVGGTRWS